MTLPAWLAAEHFAHATDLLWCELSIGHEVREQHLGGAFEEFAVR